MVLCFSLRRHCCKCVASYDAGNEFFDIRFAVATAEVTHHIQACIAVSLRYHSYIYEKQIDKRTFSHNSIII